MPAPEKIYKYPRFLLLAVYLFNGILYIQLNSIVSDEADHLNYGMRVLKGHTEKVYFDDASTLPITGLNAIPRAVEQTLKPNLKKTDGGNSDIEHGRYVTLLVCLFAALLVYRWSKELFGERAGLFSLFLFTFCPIINGHIPLIGTDAYAMLFVVSSAYYFRRFVLNSGWQNFLLFSLNLGLAQVSKQSLIILFLFYGILAIAIVLRRKSLTSRFGINLARLFVLFAVIAIVINIAFLFNGTGQSLSAYTFKSEFFQHLQKTPLIGRIPLPLPAPFVDGFDQVKYMLNLGSGHESVSPRSYLLGSYFTGNGRWYYYSVVLFFKTPLVALLLIIATIIMFIRQGKYKRDFFSTGYLLALALFFIVVISLFNRSQHGIRHLLMVYPIFYICLGQVVNWKVFKPRFAMGIVVLYSMVTFYSYFPNLLAYTNELLWNKAKVYKVLEGSTIDHFQAVGRRNQYLQKNPNVRVPTDQPEPGTFILSVNEYLDINNTGHYQWLRNFEPYDDMNYCYLLIRVTEEDLKQKRLK